ncbi:MAG: carbon-monoxide dehydrogenase large subunit [Verrucomicrobiales bacterium]|jgi:carbon-monoxide dehydrogenase large subunit
MTDRLVGQRIPRVNDSDPLHGTGEYVDDIDLPGMLHAAIVRSPIAHGRIRSFDTSDLPEGAVAFGPDDIRAKATGELPVLWILGDQDQFHTPVVDDTLRYVGQPLGLVVAASRYDAEDAVEAIFVDIEDFPAVASIEAALAADAPLLYPERGSNVLSTFASGDTKEHTDAVFAAAQQTLSTKVTIGRVHGLSMEPRGIVAVPGPRGSLTIYTSTQTAHSVRDSVCEALEMPRRLVRVIAPDVGGGFGLKDHVYEDEVMVAVAAMNLGVPIKWIEDRNESFLTTTHARDEIHNIDVAFDNDGTLRGLRVDAVRNTGGRFAIFGGGPLFTGFGAVPGPYKWDAVSCAGRVVATTTMSTGAYRGFGQTQGTMVRERAVEVVAKALGRDPVELRAQNMITSQEQPYTTRTFLEYDNGDYQIPLRRAEEMITEPSFPNDGRVRGVGYCSYVQMAGIGPSDGNRAIGLLIGGYESADVSMDLDGSVTIATGVSPHGQGLETTMAQLVADELGVPISDIELVWGDTDTAPYSAYGTAASRSISVGGGAAVVASKAVAEQIRQLAAEILEAAPGDIELVDGKAGVRGTNVSVPIVDVAQQAWQGFGLPEGAEPGLKASHSYNPASATFSFATHACRVAVDTATGEVEVEDYVVVNDCGTIVNPTIVEGQIHGAIAQGLGAALMEEMVYDQDGNPLSSTMLDYHVPVSETMPDIRIEHLETPSPYTPGGMKGMGEGGTNGAYSCVVNAIVNALPDADWSDLSTPLTPSVIWESFQSGHSDRA